MPLWCLAGCPIDSFLPPWCLPSCPNGSFLPSWCLPGASAGCPMDPFLPPWCLASCATGSQPWSPPQDLPRTGPIAIEIVLKVIQNPAPFQNRDSIGNPMPRWLSDGSFPASLVPRKLSNESFPASLVPLRLSKWSFPASPAPPCQRQSCAPSGALKASLCYGQPTVEPTPGLAANRADRH